MKITRSAGKIQLDALLFGFSVLLLTFLYGVAVGNFKIFPYAAFETATEALDELKLYLRHAGLIQQHTSENKNSLFFIPVEPPFPPSITNTDRAMQGINLVTKIDGINVVAEVLDMDGNQIHTWDVRWSRVWPEADHIPDNLVPKAVFGAPIHGAVLMDNGDLVYSYEYLGLVRMTKDGEVVWRLPYRTHHSVELDEDGNLWVNGLKQLQQKDPLFPFRPRNATKYTLLKVSPDGEILKEWFVADILHKNGYDGLLHLGSIQRANFAGPINDDRLHVNDVEPFPNSMEEGYFEKGDVLVSLRNVNTVFVFNAFSGKIKYITTGTFVLQHDADFIDGNRFSVYDNNYRRGKAGKEEKQSRIVIVTPGNDTFSVYYEGTPESPFYSSIQGKHQWLDNGNLLVTESVGGRAFEVATNGDIVWEYLNYTDEGAVSVIQQVQRYPLQHGGIVEQR